VYLAVVKSTEVGLVVDAGSEGHVVTSRRVETGLELHGEAVVLLQ
jgi:hypothetical protein